MARIEYKFWYIKENDAGFVEEVAVRFNEGDYSPYSETYSDGTVISGMAFIRSKRLGPADLRFLSKGTPSTDSAGNPITIFRAEDFGIQITKEELLTRLNQEIAKDNKRTPIDEQSQI